jgi:hypothetical protein
MDEHVEADHRGLPFHEEAKGLFASEALGPLRLIGVKLVEKAAPPGAWMFGAEGFRVFLRHAGDEASGRVIRMAVIDVFHREGRESVVIDGGIGRKKAFF